MKKNPITENPITKIELVRKAYSTETTAAMADFATYPHPSAIGRIARRWGSDPSLLRELVLNDRAQRYRQVLRARLVARLRGSE